MSEFLNLTKLNQLQEAASKIKNSETSNTQDATISSIFLNGDNEINTLSSSDNVKNFFNQALGDLNGDGNIDTDDFDSMLDELSLGTDATIDDLLTSIDNILTAEDNPVNQQSLAAKSGAVYNEETGTYSLTIEDYRDGKVQDDGEGGTRYPNGSPWGVVTNVYPEVSEADKTKVYEYIAEMNGMDEFACYTGNEIKLPILEYDENGNVTGYHTAEKVEDTTQEDKTESLVGKEQVVKGDQWGVYYKVENEDGSVTTYSVSHSGVKGNETTTYYDSDGNKTKAEVKDKNGNVIENDKYNKDGSYTKTYKNGLNHNDESIKETVYSYDKNGNITKITTKNTDGTTDVKEFDENGKEITKADTAENINGLNEEDKKEINNYLNELNKFTNETGGYYDNDTNKDNYKKLISYVDGVLSNVSTQEEKEEVLEDIINLAINAENEAYDKTDNVTSHFTAASLLSSLSDNLSGQEKFDAMQQILDGVKSLPANITGDDYSYFVQDIINQAMDEGTKTALDAVQLMGVYNEKAGGQVLGVDKDTLTDAYVQAAQNGNLDEILNSFGTKYYQDLMSFSTETKELKELFGNFKDSDILPDDIDENTNKLISDTIYEWKDKQNATTLYNSLQEIYDNGNYSTEEKSYLINQLLADSDTFVDAFRGMGCGDQEKYLKLIMQTIADQTKD